MLSKIYVAENITSKRPIDRCGRYSVQWPANSQKYDIYINEEGMHELVLKSSMFNATDFAKAFGINIHDHKYLSKERETLSCILKAFKGQEMKEQYTVDGYRVDLYFPSHKLALNVMNLGIKTEILVMRLLDKSILKRSLDVHLFDIILTLKISIYLLSSILS